MTLLESIPSLLWSKLISTSTYAAIIPILLGGGLTLFKPFVPAEDEMRARSMARIDALRELINVQVHRMLTKAVLSLDPRSLRGDPTVNPPEPDVIGDSLTEIFKIARIIPQLERLRTHTKFVHSYLYFTIAFGVVSVLLVNMVDTSRPYVALLSYIIIISQILAVGLIRLYKGRLEHYERSV